MLTIYGMSDSGNCYRWVETDTRKVPLLGLEDGSYLPESNAILHYLADGRPLLPSERLARARVLEWMFLPADSPRRAELPRLQERGNQALGVMEQHLARALLRRGALQHRRHRALRLHAPRRRRPFRPRALPGALGLAAARGTAAPLRRHGVGY
jgi:glutathione S-transferase